MTEKAENYTKRVSASAEGEAVTGAGLGNAEQTHTALPCNAGQALAKSDELFYTDCSCNENRHSC